MTSGISPKVLRPALVLFAAGIVLVALSVIIDDEDVRAIGLTALGAAVTAAGVGFAAPPGEVVTATGVPNDRIFSSDVEQKIEASPAVEPDIEQD